MSSSSHQARSAYYNMQTRNDRISALMGAYLLRGWRMLDEECEECECILLEKPDLSEKYCIGCKEVDVGTNAAAAIGSGDTGNAHPSTVSNSISHEVNGDHEEGYFAANAYNGTNGVSEEIQRLRKRGDKIAELSGAYLLKGWRMLNENCSKCFTVLLKNPTTSATYCVACEEVDKNSPPVAPSHIVSNGISTSTHGNLPTPLIALAPQSVSRTQVPVAPRENRSITVTATGRTPPGQLQEKCGRVFMSKMEYALDQLHESRSPADMRQWSETIGALATAWNQMRDCMQ